MEPGAQVGIGHAALPQSIQLRSAEVASRDADLEARSDRQHHRRNHHPHRLGIGADLDTNTYPAGIEISDKAIPTANTEAS